MMPSIQTLRHSSYMFHNRTELCEFVVTMIVEVVIVVTTGYLHRVSLSVNVNDLMLLPNQPYVVKQHAHMSVNSDIPISFNSYFLQEVPFRRLWLRVQPTTHVHARELTHNHSIRVLNT